jgi:seryl-tRNA synthetase
MIDIRRLRADPDGVKAELARKGVDLAPVDEVIELDRRQRAVTMERDSLRKQIKDLSAIVGKAMKSGDVGAADAARIESKDLGAAEEQLAAEAFGVEHAVRDLLLAIPNTPHPDAPDGVSDVDNPVVKVVGDPTSWADHQRVPHWDVAAGLGILDNERAVKISGAMFTMQRGLGATLSRALCQYALDANADAFEEIRPPSLVTTATLTATGQLPKFADDAYAIERDDLWCIPTAEVPLTSLAAGEVLAESALPMRLMAYSPCFRREAGSAGRDTRGMLRAHEFDKVEIFAYATAEQAPGLLVELRDRAESLIAGLGLTYRIIEICTGDMGQSHHRSFDIEAYAPGVDTWLEVSSVSWFSDYQARRANVRVKPTAGGGTEMAHTLNGSALAVPRVWAAILETHRQPDGSVAIPEVLHRYTRGAEVIAPITPHELWG